MIREIFVKGPFLRIVFDIPYRFKIIVVGSDDVIVKMLLRHIISELTVPDRLRLLAEIHAGLIQCDRVK